MVMESVMNATTSLFFEAHCRRTRSVPLIRAFKASSECSWASATRRYCDNLAQRRT